MKCGAAQTEYVVRHAMNERARTLGDDIRTLGDCLGTVIREQEGERVLALEERIRTRTKELREAGEDTAPMQEEIAKIDLADAARLVRAFSIYFQLINLAEEYERVRRLDTKEGPRREGIEAALRTLVEEGFDAARARDLLRRIDLGLTFTAHPTEMRRRTVRGHLDDISALLPDLARENGGAVAEVTAHVEALWTTPQLRDRTPSVADEVKAGLSHVGVIASVLPRLERDLAASFARVFGEPLGDVALPLSFHSWVGGDRDGNPNVTPEVTRETFETHAARARRAIEERVERAFANLSQNTGATSAAESEPFRRKLSALYEAIERGQIVDLARVITDLDAALREAKQARTADELLAPLRVHARSFGLHLASLDIREHSSITGKAVGELLSHAGVTDYETRDESAKVSALQEELATRRPLLAVDDVPSDDLAKVLDPLRHARAAMRGHGERAFGRYVVSMSESASDLLEVLVLAREAGVRTIPVPLFETLDDLQRAPDVMRDVFAMPAYRAALGDGVQEIMIGYSDSNKDAGFVAASWALHEAQRKLAETCAAAGVRHRFFHGRGTSIGRGGGPMVRGLLGQPSGTMAEGMRITEQGEALGDKYSRPPLAYRNLEQAIYGLLVAAGRRAVSLPEAWTRAMERAAEASVHAYRALVHDEKFLPFFEAVTPIGEIARLRIASRPVRRPGPATLKNLRAIPWVMAWTQCRANVPGWFGLGAALAQVDDGLAREMYVSWPFFRSMMENAQMSLAKTDVAVFRAYRTLASDDTLGKRIEDAFHETVAHVARIVGGEMLHEEPVLARSIALRNPYIEPIHRVQVELLSRARRLGDDAELPTELLRPILLSLHGISAGMRNTG